MTLLQTDPKTPIRKQQVLKGAMRLFRIGRDRYILTPVQECAIVYSIQSFFTLCLDCRTVTA